MHIQKNSYCALSGSKSDGSRERSDLCLNKISLSCQVSAQQHIRHYALSLFYCAWTRCAKMVPLRIIIETSYSTSRK